MRTLYKEIQNYLGLVARKSVSEFGDQVILKLACSATQTRYNIEILNVGSWGIVASRQRRLVEVLYLPDLCCLHATKSCYEFLFVRPKIKGVKSQPMNQCDSAQVLYFVHYFPIVAHFY